MSYNTKIINEGTTWSSPSYFKIGGDEPIQPLPLLQLLYTGLIFSVAGSLLAMLLGNFKALQDEYVSNLSPL